jgi:hypothetical protein
MCRGLLAAVQNAVTFQAQGAAARMLTGSDSKTLVTWQDICISGMFAGGFQPPWCRTPGTCTAYSASTSHSIHPWLHHVPTSHSGRRAASRAFLLIQAFMCD